MSFKNTCIAAAVIWIALFIVLLFYPALIYWVFALPESDSASFVLRRAAMLFLGLAVISWLIRDSSHSEARQAVCIGCSVAMLSLAVLGGVEYFRSAAGAGIWLAVVAELFLGASFFQIWIRSRNL